MSEKFSHCLGKTGIDAFLDSYWQKKPLLIRNAFPDLHSPVTAEELAGLACEEQINARLVLAEATVEGKLKPEQWQVEFGPFDESRFSQLPESNWSLLVSDVEKHIPQTRALLKKFQFIPDWRVDDLMISYAPHGGSVGPHTDAYDVFLIQLSGQRLWKISENYDKEILQNTDLCILKNFVAEQEWLLNAGDMLYLPPNVAHHGIAQQDKSSTHASPCMTASVGFRAPSLKTITSDYIHFLNENLHDATRYEDKTPVIPAHHAEISDATVAHFIEYLEQGFSLKPALVKQWLGEYCSDNKAFEDCGNEQSDLDFTQITTQATQCSLMQSPYSHFLFSYTDKAAILFVDGNSYPVSRAFAETLCNDNAIDFQQLQTIMSNDDKTVFTTLFNDGAIIKTEC